MYAAALALSPDDVYQVSRFCFIEMLSAGFTTVGEFHYLHRDPGGAAYGDPLELAERVIAAAEAVGIRICLLHVAYATGGIGEPLRPEQRRFSTPELDGYLEAVVELARRSELRPLVSVGVAPHSVRAVPRSWLHPLHELAFGYGLPLHIHASEQPAEVSSCMEAYGVRPVELLADEGLVDDYLTAVHATHLTHRELSILAQPGPIVCACPTTERDLGDGFLAGAELLEAGGRIAIGTDSQTRIAPLEEIRLLEYHERLRRLQRVVLGNEMDGRVDPGPALLDVATTAGARALRLETGTLEPSMLADFIAIDLEHPALAGWSPETLPALLALCAPDDVVRDVWVAGVRRIEGGRHIYDRDALRTFGRVSLRVFGAEPAGTGIASRQGP
jgi:formimidoylglutamate deiminase